MNCISSEMRSLMFLYKSWDPMTCYFSKGLLGGAVIMSFIYGLYSVPDVEHTGSCRRL